MYLALAIAAACAAIALFDYNDGGKMACAILCAVLSGVCAFGWAS